MPEVDLSAQFDANNTPASNDARQAKVYDAIAKVASGGKLSSSDAIATSIGVLSALNPEAGAMVATAYAALYAFGAVAMAAAKEFGFDAKNVSWNPTDNPPKDEADPRWFPDAANRASDDKFWSLDKPDLKPGTFPAFAVPVLRANYHAWMNARPSVDPGRLLLQLGEMWNNAHAGPETILDIGGGWIEEGTWGGQRFRTQHDILRIRGYVDRLTGRVTFPDNANPPIEEVRIMRINVGPLKPEYQRADDGAKHISHKALGEIGAYVPPKHVGGALGALPSLGGGTVHVKGGKPALSRNARDLLAYYAALATARPIRIAEPGDPVNAGRYATMKGRS